MDSTKNFMMMEDNDDGTMTVTINIPDFDEALVMVVAISFQEYIAAALMGIEQNSSVLEMMDDMSLMEKTTVIPDSPEEVE